MVDLLAAIRAHWAADPTLHGPMGDLPTEITGGDYPFPRLSGAGGAPLDRTFGLTHAEYPRLQFSVFDIDMDRGGELIVAVRRSFDPARLAVGDFHATFRRQLQPQWLREPKDENSEHVWHWFVLYDVTIQRGT